MKIVLDACTAILLAKCSVIECLSNSKEIAMTRYVYEEIIKGKEKMLDDAFLIERLNKGKKFKLIEGDENITKKLMKDFNMGRGEASTISAGMKEKTIIATDNLQGRKVARINDLHLIGSPEIIVSLAKNKKISNEKAKASLKIIKKEGWFDDHLIEKSMEDIEND